MLTHHQTYWVTGCERFPPRWQRHLRGIFCHSWKPHRSISPVYPAMLSLCSVTWRISPPGQLKNLCFSAQRCCVLQPSSEELNMALERSAAGFKKIKDLALYTAHRHYISLSSSLFCFYVCSFAGCFLVLVQSVIFYSGTEHLIQSRIAFGNLLL